MTYAAPGQYGRNGALPWWLIVHIQVTCVPPTARMSVTTRRHAATQMPAGTWPAPQLYQLPFISCPKPMTTGWPNARSCSP